MQVTVAAKYTTQQVCNENERPSLEQLTELLEKKRGKHHGCQLLSSLQKWSGAWDSGVIPRFKVYNTV